MTNGYTVVELRDASGDIAGYAAGPDADMAALARGVWEKSLDPGTALGTFKAMLSSKVQELRQASESLGVALTNGKTFPTDLNSQVKYLGALYYSAMNRDYAGSWNTQDGEVVSLDAAGVATVSSCVMAYIQACYAWEHTLMTEIGQSRHR